MQHHKEGLLLGNDYLYGTIVLNTIQFGGTTSLNMTFEHISDISTNVKELHVDANDERFMFNSESFLAGHLLKHGQLSASFATITLTSY